MNRRRAIRRLIPMLVAGLLCAVPVPPAGSRADALSAVLIHRQTPHDALFDIELAGDFGLAVGDHGLMLGSRDRGASWQPLIVPTDRALLGLATIPGGGAVAVGQEGVILRSDDGAAWSKVEVTIDARLFSVSIGRSGFGLASGEFGTLLRTEDHGRSWKTLSVDFDALSGLTDQPHLYDTLVLDSGTAWVVGEFGIVMQSRDEGRTWTSLHRGDESIFEIVRTSDTQYWCLGQDGLVLGSNDGGLWERVRIDTDSALLDLHIGEGGRGILIGTSGVLVTRDGGTSWRMESGVRLPAEAFALAAAHNGRYLLAGAAGTIVDLEFYSRR